ncbi:MULTISPECIES: DUF4064 domain-containing protein [unclassified Nesterenkonia]|uniref:DUF4064 domain-containing protein n=1 Tax=unclassified Nesterenkonia TaxID=2629769 RepID=UPI001F4C97FA|nr:MULTISPECIES: DUF4064 domain-containing protein [unclassified Nesterenkonia]MCH8560242.1 DUF4064 domain-containing protein [Nesterenkonia sp. DZ6]MCH8571709.1 DUF4064 domain-containing protein [Nesterenkonia sp. AY15]
MSNPPYGDQPAGFPGNEPGSQPGSQPGGYGGNQPGGYGGNQPGGFPGGEPTSKYGTDPYAPGAYGGPIAEPRKYSLLKTLTLVSLAIYVLSALPGLFMSDDLLRQELMNTAEQQGATGQEAADLAEMMLGLTTALVWVTLIIGVGLYLLVFFGLRKNKNWARITGIVFAILGILFTLFGVIGADLLTLVLVLVHVGVAVYWLVLAFSTEVKTYLAQFRR